MLYHLEAKVSLPVVSYFYYALYEWGYLVRKVALVQGRFRKFSRDKTDGSLTQMSCLSPFWVIWGVVSIVCTSIGAFNIGDLYIGAMDAVCTGNADNKSLVYSGTEALSQLSTGQGNSQGQETCSFEEAYDEFPTRWDLNATVVDSEIEGELSDTCQTNAKQMPNSVYQITNAKYEMLKNCQTHELSDEKSLKRENTKDQGESVTVPKQYIDACIRKPELQNKHVTPLFQASSKFSCLSSGGNLQVAYVLENNRNIQLRTQEQ